MAKHTNGFFTLLAGTALGVTLGVLLTPDRGSELRRTLTYQMKKYRTRLQALMKDLMRTRTAEGNAAQHASQVVIEEALEKAGQLLVDMEALTKELDQDMSLPQMSTSRQASS